MTRHDERVARLTAAGLCPDVAALVAAHPAGGPVVIGPRPLPGIIRVKHERGADCLDCGWHHEECTRTRAQQHAHWPICRAGCGWPVDPAADPTDTPIHPLCDTEEVAA